MKWTRLWRRAEYIIDYPKLDDGRTALGNRVWQVMDERVAEAAQRAARGEEGPVAEVVALAMAQTYGFIVRRPDAARAFFEGCDVVPVARHDEERREAAAEAMAEASRKILHAMRRVERAMEEQVER